MNAIVQEPGKITYSRINLGWAAGLLDGQGRVRIARRQIHAVLRSRPQYMLEVQLMQDSLRTLTHFRSIMGIEASLRPRAAIPESDHAGFTLTYRCSHARDLLELVEPYLIRLRSQAVLCLELSQQLSFNGACRRLTSLEDAALHENYHARLRALQRMAQ